MHGLGVHVAVIRHDEVLLVQREDFEVWGLPGGEIEPGETPAQAAVREVYEETGLNVRLTRLIGLYTKPQWTAANTSTAVFAAEVIGGELLTDTAETLNCGFFAKDQLPEHLIWWSRHEIEDALNGIGGSAVWIQDVPWPAGNPSRSELYRMRDVSGLSPVEFFYSVFKQGPEIAEVEGKVMIE
jgi:ADP-ribose pyrophosphatase YjhB (NUDIX family)